VILYSQNDYLCKKDVFIQTLFLLVLKSFLYIICSDSSGPWDTFLPDMDPK